MPDDSATTVAGAASVTDTAATVSGAASVAGATVATTTVPSKEDIIARAKAAIEAAIADIEAAVGHELTELRADLAEIDHTAETVWSEIEAWFKKHF